MIAEPHTRNQDPQLWLTVSVKCLDLQFPKVSRKQSMSTFVGFGIRSVPMAGSTRQSIFRLPDRIPSFATEGCRLDRRAPMLLPSKPLG